VTRFRRKFAACIISSKRFLSLIRPFIAIALERSCASYDAFAIDSWEAMDAEGIETNRPRGLDVLATTRLSVMYLAEIAPPKSLFLSKT
jgi:hypothetical protein